MQHASLQEKGACIAGDSSLILASLKESFAHCIAPFSFLMIKNLVIKMIAFLNY